MEFRLNNRGWKGASVVAVQAEMEGVSLYLCVGHFNSKSTAAKMVDDLNSKKITLTQAIEKSLKSYEKWVAKVSSGKFAGGVNRLGREQLIHFGGTTEQVARFDRAEAAFKAHVVSEMEKRKIA